ncbi:MAG TPA: alpha/beta hydrolase [Chitinophagales bacterium]|nr:alpha/beta hydrolase [Chitinophagales bacterium]
MAFLSANSQAPEYPYPVKTLQLGMDLHAVKMAYMDVPAQKPNGKAVLLLHGKNFNGCYWKDVILFLNGLGYRVIVPDQPGFGESEKPVMHYSFHQLAAGTKTLLDSLHISRVTVIGHSMGGMLATRLALMYPATVEKLILENPIGLEDYKTFVPYKPIDSLYQQERKATYDSYKKYQQSYYPEWKPEYEELVKAQAKVLTQPNFDEIARVNALTYQMIYEQPVCYEFKNITTPTLLIIGQEDRTIVGKQLLNKEQVAAHGQYPALGKQTNQQIKNSTLVELPGVGHIPHIQSLGLFMIHVSKFLQ